MKDNRNPDYPIPEDDIDLYAVDTRIWDRLKTYLDGAGGDGGGPHTHDLYADKDHDHGTHNHDGDYAPDGHTHPHDHPHDHDGSYAPSGHTHDLTHTHDEFAAGDHTHDLTHDHTEYADAQTLADHLANHPSGGDGSGGSYDDTALKARVQTNEEDIAALEAENNSQNVNIQANTDALADKADANHTHPPQDLTHDHTGIYSLEGHTHDPQDTTHTHDEYFPSGVEFDVDGNPLPLPYADGKTLGEAVDGKADEAHTHDTTHNHDADYATKTHSHPEYEGGGSGGGVSYGGVGAFTYITEDLTYIMSPGNGPTNQLSRALSSSGDGTLAYFRNWGRSTSTSTDDGAWPLWGYGPVSNFRFRILGNSYRKSSKGITYPYILNAGYGGSVGFVPEQFEEATEQGKQQLLDLIALTEDTSKITAFDAVRMKGTCVWVATDNLKNFRYIQTPQTDVETQDLTQLRNMTAEEVEAFEAEEAEQAVRDARIQAFLESVANG